MAYQTIVIDYAPKAKSMAAEVEKKANEMEQEDWELVSFAITNSAKGILVFHRPDNDFRDSRVSCKKACAYGQAFFAPFFR